MNLTQNENLLKKILQVSGAIFLLLIFAVFVVVLQKHRFTSENQKFTRDFLLTLLESEAQYESVYFDKNSILLPLRQSNPGLIQLLTEMGDFVRIENEEANTVVVGLGFSADRINTGTFSYYTEFENGKILFTLLIEEDGDNRQISGFDVQILDTSEQNKMTAS